MTQLHRQSDVTMKNSRVWRRAALRGLFFLSLLGGMLVIQFMSLQHRAPLTPRTMVLLGTKVDSADFHPVLAIAKRRLAKAPNDASSLNLLYVAAINEKPDGPAAQYIGTLLSQLGWRNTAALQNLIMTATAERDFGAIVKISDALLRRNQASHQILTLLRLVEVEPDTRRYLVRRLAFNPPWKAEFLRESDSLTTSAQALARGETLKMMLADGQKIDRRDFAPSLQAMVRTGEMEVARKLYREYTSQKKNSIINDSDFLSLAQSRDANEYRPLPFDWQNHSTRGVQIRASESIGKAEVEIRWNGRGTPLMLSQYVHIPREGLYKLELTGLDAKLNLPQLLQFSIRCEQGNIRFKNVQEDLKANNISLMTEKMVTCKFPRLEIRGRIQDIPRSHTLNLSSVRLFQIS